MFTKQCAKLQLLLVRPFLHVLTKFLFKWYTGTIGKTFYQNEVRCGW